MSRTCIAFRHLAFEDLGTLAPAIEGAGYAIRYVEVGVDRVVGQVNPDDLLVVLGGPIGVYETERYPYVAEEIAVIADHMAGGARTLGICLGLQLMAAATGATVEPGSAKEIGWAPISLTDAGEASVLAPLEGLPVLHWHGDEAALVPPSICLATTEICANQAFAVGSRALALQFHIEADPARIEQWLIGHTAELAVSRIDLNALRADTRRFGPRTAEVGQEIIRRWLSLGD